MTHRMSVLPGLKASGALDSAIAESAPKMVGAWLPHFKNALKKLAEAPHIERIQGERWAIGEYEVSNNITDPIGVSASGPYFCTCQGGRSGNMCKHRVAIRLVVRALAFQPVALPTPKPVAPAVYRSTPRRAPERYLSTTTRFSAALSADVAREMAELFTS